MAFNIVAGVNNAVYGSVSGSGSYEENAEVTLEVTVNEGYRFVQWDDGNTDNPRVFNAVADVTLVATLEAIPEYAVTLTANNNNLGSVSGDGNYLEGSTATISATPALHCRFVKWDDDNTDNPRTLTVNAAVTLEAIFEAIIYSDVTIASNDTELGTVSGATSGNIETGSSITLTATPATDCKFDGWQVDGEMLEDTSTTITLTVTANEMDIIAVFSAIVFYQVNLLSSDTDCGHITVVSQTAEPRGVNNNIWPEGTELELQAVRETGGRFLNWGDGDKSLVKYVTVSGNETIRANFYPSSGLILVTKKILNQTWTTIKNFFAAPTGASKIGAPANNALGATTLADVVNSVGQANGLAQLNEDGKINISDLGGSGSSGLDVDITGNAATATVASKVGLATVGSISQPVYMNAGTPAVCKTFAYLYGSEGSYTTTVSYLTVTSGSDQVATYKYNNGTSYTYMAPTEVDVSQPKLTVTISKSGNYIDFEHVFENLSNQYDYTISDAFNMPYLTAAPSYSDSGSSSTEVQSGTYATDEIVVRCSSSYGEGSPWYLVRYGQNSNFFNTSNVYGDRWFEIYTSTAINVKEFSLLPRQDGYGASEYPKEFKLQGSNDGVSYTDIASYIQSTSVSINGVFYTYKCSNNIGLYKYHRLFVYSRMSKSNNNTDNVISLSKFYLTEAYTSVPTLVSPAANSQTVTSSSSSSSILPGDNVAAAITQVPTGSVSQPVFVNSNGRLEACTTVVADVAAKIGTTTVGSSTAPVYINAGTPTACGGSLDVDITGNSATATSAAACTGNAATASVADKIGSSTVGSSTEPVYINAGVPTACGSSLAVDITGNAATATTASACSGNATTATTASACSGNAATSTKTAVTVATGATHYGIATVPYSATSGSAYDITRLQYANNRNDAGLYFDADATSGNQRVILILGNQTANTTAAGKNGQFQIYGTNTGHTMLIPGYNSTSGINVYLPSIAGYIPVSSDNSIKNIVKVASLPASPDANTFYIVTGN